MAAASSRDLRVSVMKIEGKFQQPAHGGEHGDDEGAGSDRPETPAARPAIERGESAREPEQQERGQRDGFLHEGVPRFRAGVILAALVNPIGGQFAEFLRRLRTQRAQVEQRGRDAQRVDAENDGEDQQGHGMRVGQGREK